MNKFLMALSAAALLASAGVATAGGLNAPAEEPEVMTTGPGSSFPLWLVVPLIACAVACGNGGTGGTGGTGTVTGG